MKKRKNWKKRIFVGTFILGGLFSSTSALAMKHSIDPSSIEGTTIEELENLNILTNNQIDFGQAIGSGSYGDVYNLEGNPNYVIKTFNTSPDYVIDDDYTVIKKLITEEKLQELTFSAKPLYALTVDIGGVPTKANIFKKRSGSLREYSRKPDYQTNLNYLRNTMVSLICSLSRFHEKGLVHGDLHQSNILLKQEKDFKAVLADFGFVYSMKYGISYYCSHADFVEQDIQQNPQAKDIFCLGIIFCELLTGYDASNDKRDGIANYDQDYYNHPAANPEFRKKMSTILHTQLDQFLVGNSPKKNLFGSPEAIKKFVQLIKQMTSENDQNRPSIYECTEILSEIIEENSDIRQAIPNEWIAELERCANIPINIKDKLNNLYHKPCVIDPTDDSHYSFNAEKTLPPADPNWEDPTKKINDVQFFTNLPKLTLQTITTEEEEKIAQMLKNLDHSAMKKNTFYQKLMVELKKYLPAIDSGVFTPSSNQFIEILQPIFIQNKKNNDSCKRIVKLLSTEDISLKNQRLRNLSSIIEQFFKKQVTAKI